jgi:ferric-dicitrate binding protein FerR (iron transport regulator)
MSDDEEDLTAQLLRLADAPPDPPDERTARVREAVRREWHAGRRRRMILQGTTVALLGVAASVLIAVWMNRPHSVEAPSGRGVAIAERIQGRPLILRNRANAPETFAGSALISHDDVIETDALSRAALQTADGSSVRIDRASRVRFIGPAVIEVIAGAAYVATADRSHGFEVRTSMGTLRDMGTQFEVRLTMESVRVRVRVGAVAIERAGRVATAAAGTEAVVTTTGITVRQVPAYGPEWTWASDIAPSFAIEGRPLREFLEYITAEEGWTLRYANRDVADAATRIILHGSVDGLTAEDALRVVLATSGLEYRLRAGELLVSRSADAR